MTDKREIISADNNQMVFIQQENMYDFEPLMDITASEVALIISLLEVKISKEIFDKLQEKTKRHFKEALK